MQKYAEYIKEIEIDSLWSGKKHVCWELHRQVNILSGINGVGKSTISTRWCGAWPVAASCRAIPSRGSACVWRLRKHAGYVSTSSALSTAR